MTNISAFKINEEQDKPSKNIVLVADSQVTSAQTGEKYDSSQKLFALGDSLLMYSGNTSLALSVFSQLKRSSVKGAGEIAKQILDISTRNRFSPSVGLDFIVGGFEDEAAKLYFVNSTGRNKFAPNKSSSRDKFLHEGSYALSGSGSRFAERVLGGQVNVGIDPRPTSITEGFSLIRALASAAIEDLGVNDRFQYGVITPTGSHVLFHPEVNPFGVDEAREYFKKLLGLETAPFVLHPSLENVAFREANRPLALVSGDFYNNFDQTLELLNISTRDYRLVTDLYLKGKAKLPDVELARTKYLNSKSEADLAVNALLSGKVSEIRDFLKEYQSRREQMYSSAFDKKD